MVETLLRRLLFTLLVTVGLSTGTRAAGPLDPYLVHPEDVPGDCRRIDGLFPMTDKISTFYDYRAYRQALPPAADRHAQSFDCGGVKGTLYFFAYNTTDQRESAELFAKPILMNAKPAPVFLSWNKGFLIVSFSEAPASLTAVIEKKISAPSMLSSTKTHVMASPPVAVSTAPAAAPLLATPAAPPVAAAPPLVSTPIASSTPLPAEVVPDVSNYMIGLYEKKLDCKKGDLPEDAQEACRLLKSFKSGRTVEARVPADSIRMGPAFSFDPDGQLLERFYVAVFGTGQIGEITLFRIHPANGVEEFECQAVIDSRRQGKPLPSNDVVKEIMSQVRPTHPLLVQTTGHSMMLRGRESDQVYLRQVKDQWIVLLVTGEGYEQNLHSPFSVAVLF